MFGILTAKHDITDTCVLYYIGLSWVAVSNVDDVNKAFLIGHNNRATASTNMNEHSSRSHALLCVEVLGENITTGAKTLGKSKTLQ